MTTEAVRCAKLQPNHHCQGVSTNISSNKLCGRPVQYAHAPCKLTFDILTLKVLSEPHVMWTTSVPILIFLGLSVLDLGPIYATDSQTQMSDLLNAPYPRGGSIIIIII